MLKIKITEVQPLQKIPIFFICLIVNNLIFIVINRVDECKNCQMLDCQTLSLWDALLTCYQSSNSSEHHVFVRQICYIKKTNQNAVQHINVEMLLITACSSENICFENKDIVWQVMYMDILHALFIVHKQTTIKWIWSVLYLIGSKSSIIAPGNFCIHPVWSSLHRSKSQKNYHHT